ncbi:MAG: putative dsRNA-binding protein, partial [Limnochordia bacterium]
ILEHVTWADKEHLEKQLSIIDAKSTLQERFQQLGRELPTYYLVQEQGPDHAKEFVMEVIFDGKVLGKGVGRSKKEAAQNAAREALANLDNNHDLGQERHS